MFVFINIITLFNKQKIKLPHAPLMALLQIDIEGDEWIVLKQVAQQPIMDLIGQVSDRLDTHQ